MKMSKRDGCGIDRAAGANVRTLGRVAAAVVLFAVAALAAAGQGGSFKETSILSDGFVPAKATDATFVNPWGIAPGGRFWINSTAGGYDVLSDVNGVQSFKVKVPGVAAGSQGLPTGTVAQTSTTQFLLPNGRSSSFLFCTLNGTVSAWNAGLGTTGSVAVNMVDRSAQKAAYTDMALATNPAGTFLLLANFSVTSGSGIDVFDSTWKAATLSGGTFTDPNLPAGYFPFGIHTIGTQVFVTYIQKNASGLELVLPGNGIVSVFDTTGKFVARAITGGNLNAPWGMAKAPATFGVFGNDLLVGNFGDGVINVYDPTSFAYLGQITDGGGAPISYPGLWEIMFGPGATGNAGGDSSILYFAAGLSGETHGLFGSIDALGTGTPSFALSGAANSLQVAPGATGALTIALTPTNGFSGPVTLACSGLPAGATCTFAQPSVAVTAAASATTSMTVTTTAQKSGMSPLRLPGEHTGAIAAFALPLLGLLSLRRRSTRKLARCMMLLPIALAGLVLAGSAMGCGDSAIPTPVGATPMTVTATSGATSKTASITLIVQ